MRWQQQQPELYPILLKTAKDNGLLDTMLNITNRLFID